MEVLFKRMRTTEGSEGDGEGKAGAEEEAVNEAAAVAVGAEEEMELHIQRIMVRIEQFTEKIRMFLSKADALSRKWDIIPILLAGDFNSTPDSAIYEFLSTSEALNCYDSVIEDCDIHDNILIDTNLRLLIARRICKTWPFSSFLFLYPQVLLCSFLKFKWTNDEVRNATGYSKSEQVKHPLMLRSSYATIQGSARTRGPQGEPLATSYHSKFLGTVDYIWYSTGLGCRKVLDTLPIDTLRKIGGLPTKEMGSDHLALVAEFIFTESSELDHPDSTDNSAEEETTISKTGISLN